MERSAGVRIQKIDCIKYGLYCKIGSKRMERRLENSDQRIEQSLGKNVRKESMNVLI